MGYLWHQYLKTTGSFFCSWVSSGSAGTSLHGSEWVQSPNWVQCFMFQSIKGVPRINSFNFHVLPLALLALLCYSPLEQTGFSVHLKSSTVFVGVASLRSLQLEAELVFACLLGIDVVQSSPGSVELSLTSHSVVTLSLLCMRGRRSLLVYFCYLLLLFIMVALSPVKPLFANGYHKTNSQRVN